MKTRKAVSAALLLLSLCLIAIGILQGQHTQLYEKAVRICMECLGIG